MPRGRPLRQSQTGDAEEHLLIEEAQRDPARFANLYDIYFDRIYAYVAHRVGSREESEDLVSEVFHKALANLRRFEWKGAPFSGCAHSRSQGRGRQSRRVTEAALLAAALRAGAAVTHGALAVKLFDSAAAVKQASR